MWYKETPDSSTVECRLIMSSGEDHWTLQVSSTDGKPVIRVHLTHDQLGRVVSNQVVTIPVQVFKQTEEP